MSRLMTAVANLRDPPSATAKAPRIPSPDWQKAKFAAPAMLLIGGVFLAPLVIVLLQSFARDGLTLEGYEKILGSTLFWRVLRNTLEITLGAMLLSLLAGYPLAYFMSLLRPAWRAVAMILV